MAITTLTVSDPATFMAHQRRRKTPSIEENHALLTLLKMLPHIVDQGLRQTLIQMTLPHIEHFYVWRLGVASTFGQAKQLQLVLLYIML